MLPKGYVKVPSNLSRKNNTEKDIAKKLLDDFIPKGSKGESLIIKIFHLPINQISLTALIQVSIIISEMLDIKFPRNFKRKKDLIVKWFNDHFDYIDKYSNYIEVVFDKTEKNYA